MDFSPPRATRETVHLISAAVRPRFLPVAVVDRRSDVMRPRVVALPELSVTPAASRHRVLVISAPDFAALNSANTRQYGHICSYSGLENVIFSYYQIS